MKKSVLVLMLIMFGCNRDAPAPAGEAEHGEEHGDDEHGHEEGEEHGEGHGHDKLPTRV